MWNRLKLKYGLKVILVTVGLLVLIGFTERKQNAAVCNDIVINIDNQYDNYFVDEHDILALISNNGNDVIKGVSFKNFALKDIENRLNDEKFIKHAQIYKDLKGNVLVSAQLRRPFARILPDEGPNVYIASDGTILPVSEKFSSRVVLISGKYATTLAKEDLMDTENGRLIYDLLKYINEDKFWRAQIAQIEINEALDIILYPQVTKQLIEFGTPTDLETKFRKLKIFYKQILPQKGWNKYSRVNLKYENQIVAE